MGDGGFVGWLSVGGGLRVGVAVLEYEVGHQSSNKLNLSFLSLEYKIQTRRIGARFTNYLSSISRRSTSRPQTSLSMQQLEKTPETNQNHSINPC